MAEIHLWQIREREGISLRKLEEVTEIGKTTLNNIENGKISPTIEQVEKICNALGITFKELFSSKYNP